MSNHIRLAEDQNYRCEDCGDKATVLSGDGCFRCGACAKEYDEGENL